MEEYRSYTEQFNQARPLLSEWCDHLVKVEVELRKLAQKFGEWDVEAKSTTTDPIAANVAGPTNSTRCVESSCSGPFEDLIHNTFELLEQDRVLAGNLTGTIEALKEKHALLLTKLHEFEENHVISLPVVTEDYLLIVVVLLHRVHLSNQSVLLGALYKMVDTKFSSHLTEIVRNITNLAFECSRSPGEVVLPLRSIADIVEKWRNLRCEVVESVGLNARMGTCVSNIRSSVTRELSL